MLFVYIGLYTFILAIAWGLFIVAKMHSHKFKNFSTNIEKVTTVLFIFLLLLSLIGYILIFFGAGNINNSASINTSNTYNDVYY